MTERRPWLWWVAGRYLRTRRAEKKNIIASLSVIGLAVGVAALICVISGMNGLQSGTIKPTMEIESYHLRIEGPAAAKVAGTPALAARLQEAVPAIRGLVPFAESQVLVYGAFGDPQYGQLRVLPPGEIGQLLARLPELRLLSGEAGGFTGDTVFIGEGLSVALSATRGDLIHLNLLEGGSGEGLRDVSLRVGGVLHFKNSTFDRFWLFTPANSSLGGGLMANPIIGLRLADAEADESARADLAAELVALGAPASTDQVVSWRSYNSSIFGALRVEKLMMVIIVGIIFIVLGVNIFHFLRVSVYEKQEDIGVLRSLGATPGEIKWLFVAQGLLMGLIGGLSGFAAGTLIIANIKPIFSLVGRLLGSPESLLYFAQSPPVLVWSEAVFIGLAGLACPVVAAWIASRPVANMDPAKILRHE